MIARAEPWVPTTSEDAKLGHVFDSEFDDQGSTTGPERMGTMSYTYAEAYGDLLQELKRELSDRVDDIARTVELFPDPLSASRQYAAGRRDQLNDVITRAEFLQAGIGSGEYMDPFEGSREGDE